MPDFSGTVVTALNQVVQVNSSVPGSYDSVGRLGLGWYNVKEYGATGDGTTNDSAAIQAAITAAIAGKGGTVWFPAGIYRCSSGFTIPGGILLQGAGSPAASSGTTQAFVQLWHDFNGDFITWSDQNASGVVMGGGIDRIALVQNFGSSGGAVCGKAITVTAPASGSVQAWMRFTNMQVEQFSSTAPWTYCLYADGTASATQLRDWWFSEVRMAAGAGATGGLYLSGMVNCFLSGVEMNNSATITVTGDGTHRSSNIHFTGCSCAGAFNLDYADTILVTGGNYTTWSNTANTGAASAPCVLLPAYSASLLTNNAGANCLFAVYNTTNGLRYQRPLTEDNGVFFSGMTVAGAIKRLVGVSNADVLNLDFDGLGSRFGGAITVVGAVSPSVTATHDLGSPSFSWDQLFLSGNATVQRVVGAGTAHVAGDYVASANWGTTPTITPLARDTGGRVSVLAQATTGANPTLALTFKDGTWTTVPAISYGRGDVAAPTTCFWALTTITATVATFTLVGTPTAGNTYILDFTVMGK